MAIEDAATLAAELSRESDVPLALAGYGRARGRRVADVQRLARRNATAYHAGGPVAAFRNLVMSRLGPEGMLARYDWIYGWRLPGS